MLAVGGVVLWHAGALSAQAPSEASTALPTDARPVAPASHTLRTPGWAPPVSVQWTYEVRASTKGLPYRAQATLSWRRDGRTYDARLEFKAFLIGSRVQHSQGTLGPQGLVPQTFTDRARKERQLVFDWGAARLIAPGPPESSTALPPGTQDRLSLFLQLAHTLGAAGDAPAPGQQWVVPVASPGEVAPWTFRFEGRETLELPAGTWSTWKLQRSPRHAGDQRVELWFAPDLHLLPVRMRISQDNGDTIDQRLSAH